MPDPGSLGMLLKRYRQAAGLSQEALAARAGLSERAISDLERGLKRRPHFDTLALLTAALSLSAQQSSLLRAAARPDLSPESALPEESALIRHNFPVQLTSFVGRETELIEITTLLHAHRLVTLTGTGGAGKTRLAIQAATFLGRDFSDGVWFVDLTPLSRPELVLETVLNVVSREETPQQALPEALVSRLKSKSSLLLLDNCEHLVEECARVVELLLVNCPELRILATSREALRIPGEYMLLVPSLDCPTLQHLPAASELSRYPAVQLFVERAQGRDPSFLLTEHTASAVAEICLRLDGMPLALELAAARVGALSVTQIAARLDKRFLLLAGGTRTAIPRQHTLQTLLDWSYSLLTEREQVVFRRLAVFARDWSLEAAETVCAGDYEGAVAGTIQQEEVLDLIVGLVHKSLVTREHAGGERYRLLETIHLYAQQKLQEADETALLRQQQGTYYLHLAEVGASQLHGPTQKHWLEQLDLEHDNLRTALGWAIETDQGEAAVRLALALWPFWDARPYQREGLRWLERILALHTQTPLPADLLPHLYTALGGLSYMVRSPQTSAYLQEALGIWQQRGDRAGIASALFYLGWNSFTRMELEAARDYARESLALARDLGERRLIAQALDLYALALIELHTRESGLPAMLEESLAIWRELGDVGKIATTLDTLVNAELQLGHREQAKPLLAEALRLHLQVGTYSHLIGSLIMLSQLSLQYLHHPQGAIDAARMQGVFKNWKNTMGLTEDNPWDIKGHEEMIRVQAVLGAETFAREFAAGERLTLDEVLLLADAITRPEPEHTAGPALTPATSPRFPNDLTEREVEVLRLVASGWSNLQIAEHLVLSRRTVDAHLRSIFNKIAVSSRSAATRFALDHRLC